MIYFDDTNEFYIGKSIDYMGRLKSHLRDSNNDLEVDKTLTNRKGNCSLYLLMSYSNTNLNFFNRKYETIIEQTFINIAMQKQISTLNKKIYGHLQII